MSGILLLAVIGIWIAIVVKLKRLVAQRIPPAAPWRRAAIVAFVLTMVALPVADEIVGGIQLWSLCRERAVLKLGVKNPAGRVTRYSGEPIDEPLAGTAIPILHSHIEYHDVATGELVAAYERYVAKGGLFIRTLGISQRNSPLVIGSPSCSAEHDVTLPSQLKFRVIN